MMDPRKTFQYILMGLGGVLLVVAVIMFASYRATNQATQIANGTAGAVSLWGPFPVQSIGPALSVLQTQYPDIKISYTFVPSDEFEKKFAESLVAGRSPDLIIFNDQYALLYSQRLVSIPFSILPQSTFANTFVDGAVMFTLSDAGVFGFPIGVDPLVLYYNHDLLSSALLVRPAQTWTEIIDQSEKITEKTTADTVEFATVPLGVTSNIRHAVDILSLLSFQNGNPLVGQTISGPVSYFAGMGNVSVDTSFGGAIKFFASFSDTTQKNYTWNALLPEARDVFAQEKSLYYIGYASEYNELRKQNPNLNFGIAPVPQISVQKNTKKTTVGRMYAVGISRQSKNQPTAYTVASTLMTTEPTNAFVTASAIAPLRRDLLEVKQSDIRLQNIYESAIIAKSWLNPDPVNINNLIVEAVIDYRSSVRDISDIISTLNARVERALVPFQIVETQSASDFNIEDGL